MSTPEQNNDTPPIKITPSKAELWFTDRWSELKLLTKTIIALVFIVNSITLAFMAFGFVEPNYSTAKVIGSISVAFASIVLGTFVHQGVKFQSTTKRKR